VAQSLARRREIQEIVKKVLKKTAKKFSSSGNAYRFGSGEKRQAAAPKTAFPGEKDRKAVRKDSHRATKRPASRREKALIAARKDSHRKAGKCQENTTRCV